MIERHDNARRHRSAPIVALSLLIGWWGGTVWSGQAAPDGFEVGQRWQYQHEGPRPGSVEPNSIGGEGILYVTSVAQEQEGTQWVMEERFTHDAGVTTRLYVNEKQMLTMVEIKNRKGEAAKLRYDPPIPYGAANLATGEKRTMETTLKMDAAEFTLPSTTTVERLENETILTAAEEFAGCWHYRTTTISTVNIKIAKIPLTEEREQWYHPRIHGLVKEVYRRGPIKFLIWSRPGYTATSVLTAFGREDVKATVVSAAQTDVNDRGNVEPRKPAPRTSFLKRTSLLLLAMVGILAVGSLVRAKWVRRKR